MSGEVKASSGLPADVQMPGSTGKALSLPISSGPTFYASKADETILRLAKLIKTTAGLGSLMSVSAYSLYIAAYIHAIAPARTEILAKISHLLGRPAPKLPPSIATPAAAGSPFAAIITIINDTRFAIRLTGLIPLYVLLRSLIKVKNPKDAILHNLALVQAGAYIVFQVYENLWLLAAKGVLSSQWVEKRGGAMRFLKWSCRAWLLALTCDLARLAREAMVAKEVTAEKALSEEQQQQVNQKWWGELISAGSFYPMGIHYSLDGGIGLNQGLVGLSGFLGGLGGFTRAWAATKD